MSELTQFRQAMDRFMARHPQSPLSDELLAGFTGLNYYTENPVLSLTVTVNRLPNNEPLITMATSTGELRLYRRWATFSFPVNGEIATLTIYSDPYGHDFFLPFKDETNGRETYSAGRYLDNHRPGLEQLDDATFAVDFNYSYNPYCAYDEGYSCPLPPHENWLKFPITAGEKSFK